MGKLYVTQVRFFIFVTLQK